MVTAIVTTAYSLNNLMTS